MQSTHDDDLVAVKGVAAVAAVAHPSGYAYARTFVAQCRKRSGLAREGGGRNEGLN